jgi:hypothetical protein
MSQKLAVNAVFPKLAPAVPLERSSPAARRLRQWAFVLIGALLAGGLTSPAAAEPEPSTKLIRCGGQSCLQISGRRDDPAAIVSVNGHVVPVEGRHRWRIRLPVEAVRQWSARHARTIEVSLRNPGMPEATVIEIDLPTGMLGRMTDLASLVVSLR